MQIQGITHNEQSGGWYYINQRIEILLDSEQAVVKHNDEENEYVLLLLRDGNHQISSNKEIYSKQMHNHSCLKNNSYWRRLHRIGNNFCFHNQPSDGKRRGGDLYEKDSITYILTLFCVHTSLVVGCGRSMDDIIKNEVQHYRRCGRSLVTTPYLFPSIVTLTLTEHYCDVSLMQRTKMTWLISTLVMKSLSITMV